MRKAKKVLDKACEFLVEGGRMKPILFNTEMVRAILDGRKTVTRRPIKLDLGLAGIDKNDPTYLKIPDKYGDYHDAKDLCRYKVGDVLYVRETFCEIPYEYEHIPIKNGHITVPKIAYRADSKVDYTGIWKPSIHMPKELARIFLKVTDVRVERLQDITAEQQENELGILDIDSPCNTCSDNNMSYCGGGPCLLEELFIELWDSTIQKLDLDKYGWEADPWVWVIEFERVEVVEE